MIHVRVHSRTLWVFQILYNSSPPFKVGDPLRQSPENYSRREDLDGEPQQKQEEVVEHRSLGPRCSRVLPELGQGPLAACRRLSVLSLACSGVTDAA